MAFYARSFTYAGVESEYYGLLISSNDSGESSSPSADVELKTQSIFRRPVRYFYGTTPANVLEFDVTFRTSEEDLTAEDAALAQTWLFGAQNYNVLRIQQPDMQSIYFNAIFTNPEIIRVGNLVRGFNAKVVCDSPFAYDMTRTNTYNTNGAIYSTTILNYSENNYYTFPLITVTMLGVGGSFNIVNTTDNNRTLEFTGLSGGEVLTINNDLQIITSSTGLRRINNATSPIQFFRLVPGINNITISGSISSVVISYVPMRRMS